MVRKFAVSFSDWVYQQYVDGYKGNRSKYVEEYFVKGVQAETGDQQGNSAKMVELLKVNRNMEDELKKTKLQLESCLNKLTKKPSEEEKANQEELENRTKLLKAMKDAGSLRDGGDL